VDVLPTVLDLLNVSSPSDMRFDGRSLAAAVRHPTTIDDPIVYAETLVPLRHFGWSDLRVLREGRWKYIQAPRPELYDVVTDPAEERNLVDAQASRARAMRAGLAKLVATEQTDVDVAAAGARSIPSDVLQRLGALGYVHADSTSRGGAGSTGLADPKDKIEEFRAASDLIREGLIRFDAREYPASIAAFRKVLALGVDGFEVHLFLGKALAASGQPREAAMHFGVATERAPSQLSAWERLVDALIAAKNPDAALRAVDRGRGALPSAVSLRLREARLLRDVGRTRAAVEAYENALALAPHDGSIHCEVGDLWREVGDVQKAIARLQEGVTLEPASGECWNSLAVTLGGAGRVNEAERAFREAVARDPKNHYYAYNLGFLLLQQGRTAEAREWFERSASDDPRFDPARKRLAELSHARPDH
jgi:tetratricopeptide (TPR) repeat protein